MKRILIIFFTFIAVLITITGLLIISRSGDYGLFIAGEAFSLNKLPFLDNFKTGFYNNIIAENRYLLIIEGLKTTITISVYSCFLGTILGSIICYMRMSKHIVPVAIAKVYISTIRGVPVLVLLMLMFYWAFASVSINSAFVAVIAFGMNFAAYVSEMFRAGISGVDKGQYEAGIACGFNKYQTFVYIIIPQALRQVIPVYKGEFITMVKMTSVVGYIAVMDLTKASDIIRSRTFDAFFPLVMVAVLYYMATWVLVLFLDYIAIKTDPKRKRRKLITSDKSYPSLKKIRRA